MNSRLQKGSKVNVVKKQKKLQIQLQSQSQSQNQQNRHSAQEILPKQLEDLDLLDEPEAEANTSSYDNGSHGHHQFRGSFDNSVPDRLNGYQLPNPFNLSRTNSIQANYKLDHSSRLEISQVKGDQIQSQKQLQLNMIMDVPDSSDDLTHMIQAKRGSHLVENHHEKLLKKRNDYGQKDNARSINDNIMPDNNDFNSQPSFGAENIGSMAALRGVNLYPSQSKLQATSKLPSKMSQYDMIDSESSPKVPHFISNVETSKIQDSEGMSSNYDMNRYKKQQAQMLVHSSSELLFQIGVSNSNPDLIQSDSSKQKSMSKESINVEDEAVPEETNFEQFENNVMSPPQVVSTCVPTFQFQNDEQELPEPIIIQPKVPLDKAEMKVEKKSTDKDEIDSFQKQYNKEIKVNQDEIPTLLSELTDIAYNFIKKDKFEKAYVLLQKTESILEVVNLSLSRRDRYYAFITYHNMALCFQQLGMLQECSMYLKETISVMEQSNFFVDKTISNRMKQIQILCQLRLQLCAIQSQAQNHTLALENAKESSRQAHQLFKDMYDLCVFYSNKIKFRDDFSNLSFLQVEIPQEEQEKKNIEKQYIQENSPVRDIPHNILEESISMIERTALKLLPILKELGNRLAGTNGRTGFQAFHAGSSVEYEQSSESVMKKSSENSQEQSQGQPGPDMKTILGFLNQNEWISTINIGNIMQIKPFQMKDLLESQRNEQELSRESFLEKLTLLIVSYFCISTEMRFLVQSQNLENNCNSLEQEYYHVRALDLACAFLPNECPMLSHIILSYQKHHEQNLHTIGEDTQVIKALNGIENAKYQTIVRKLNNVKVEVNPLPLSPLSKCMDERLVKTQKQTQDKGQQAFIPTQVTPVKKQEIGMMTDSPQVVYQIDYQDKLIENLLDDKKIKNMQKFVNKLGLILNQPTSTQRKLKLDNSTSRKFKPDNSTSGSYSNLSTVDQYKSQFEVYGQNPPLKSQMKKKTSSISKSNQFQSLDNMPPLTNFNSMLSNRTSSKSNMVSVQENFSKPTLVSQYFPKNNTQKKSKILHSNSGLLANPKAMKIHPIQILKNDKKQSQRQFKQNNQKFERVNIHDIEVKNDPSNIIQHSAIPEAPRSQSPFRPKKMAISAQPTFQNRRRAENFQKTTPIYQKPRSVNNRKKVKNLQTLTRKNYGSDMSSNGTYSQGRRKKPFYSKLMQSKKTMALCQKIEKQTKVKNKSRSNSQKSKKIPKKAKSVGKKKQQKTIDEQVDFHMQQIKNLQRQYINKMMQTQKSQNLKKPMNDISIQKGLYKRASHNITVGGFDFNPQEKHPKNVSQKAVRRLDTRNHSNAQFGGHQFSMFDNEIESSNFSKSKNKDLKFQSLSNNTSVQNVSKF